MRIRPAAEILATLDDRGALDGLPFMPEMARWCGRAARVSRRADKSCDTVDFRGQRRLVDTVHLTGLRCDGSAHGGCQAACLTFWKEAWLERVPAGPDGTPTAEPAPGTVVVLPMPRVGPDPASVDGPGGGDRGALELRLAAGTHATPPVDPDDGAEVWSCQATRLLDASRRLRWWDPRQYARDLAGGDVRVPTVVRGTLLFLFNNVQNLTRRFLPRRLRFRDGSWYPFVTGKLARTPKVTLDLRPGEVVEVLPKEEILATLDTSARNRGLSFDAEMARWCGRRARVLRRVDSILDERTGRMLHLKGDCIVLEGVYCTGASHGLCPREVYPYWREIWLRRVPDADPATGRPAVAAGAES